MKLNDKSFVERHLSLRGSTGSTAETFQNATGTGYQFLAY